MSAAKEYVVTDETSYCFACDDTTSEASCNLCDEHHFCSVCGCPECGATS